MRTLSVTAGLALAFVGNPLALSAQNACAEAAQMFAQAPTLGDWVEMNVSKKGDSKVTGIRAAFVKSEQRGGKKLYWLQTSMTDPESGQRMLFQALMPWGPEAFGSSPQYQEVVLKMGDQPAMKMAGDMPGSRQDTPDFQKYCKDAKLVGEEKLSTPAGTFNARHYKSPESESWISGDVPVWGMAKLITDDGITIVVTAKGTGAKNEITEEPMDMSEAMKNPEMMKKMMEGMKKK